MAKADKTDKESKYMYRQSCDLPYLRHRIEMATPHVPYVKKPKAVELPAEEPTKKKTKKVSPEAVDPARVRRGFHMRIALTAITCLSFLLVTHLK